MKFLRFYRSQPPPSTILQPGEKGSEEIKLMENSLLCLLHVHYSS